MGKYAQEILKIVSLYLIGSLSRTQVLWNGPVSGRHEEEGLSAVVDVALSPLSCGEHPSPRSTFTDRMLFCLFSLRTAVFSCTQIRKATASQVYEMLLTYDDVIDDEQVLADVMASLSDTNW